MKKIIYSVISIAILLVSCDLYEEPKDQTGKEAIFGSESGLKTYTYSFYNMLPTGSDLNQIEIDLVAFISFSDFFFLFSCPVKLR